MKEMKIIGEKKWRMKERKSKKINENMKCGSINKRNQWHQRKIMAAAAGGVK
jgi:hypothetical protein